jgi:hypothetical protein
MSAVPLEIVVSLKEPKKGTTHRDPFLSGYAKQVLANMPFTALSNQTQRIMFSSRMNHCLQPGGGGVFELRRGSVDGTILNTIFVL